MTWPSCFSQAEDSRRGRQLSVTVLLTHPWQEDMPATQHHRGTAKEQKQGAQAHFYLVARCMQASVPPIETGHQYQASCCKLGATTLSSQQIAKQNGRRHRTRPCHCPLGSLSKPKLHRQAWAASHRLQQVRAAGRSLPLSNPVYLQGGASAGKFA